MTNYRRHSEQNNPVQPPAVPLESLFPPQSPSMPSPLPPGRGRPASAFGLQQNAAGQWVSPASNAPSEPQAIPSHLNPGPVARPIQFIDLRDPATSYRSSSRRQPQQAGSAQTAQNFMAQALAAGRELSAGNEFALAAVAVEAMRSIYTALRMFHDAGLLLLGVNCATWTHFQENVESQHDWQAAVIAFNTPGSDLLHNVKFIPRIINSTGEDRFVSAEYRHIQFSAHADPVTFVCSDRQRMTRYLLTHPMFVRPAEDFQTDDHMVNGAVPEPRTAAQPPVHDTETPSVNHRSITIRRQHQED